MTEAKEVAVSETVRADSATSLALDSVSELVEIRTEPVLVPMSAVTLTIATDSLLSLPGGASYSGRSGQASVKVSRVGNAADGTERIVVYATCDSLQLQCERYERQIRNLRSERGERLSEVRGHGVAMASQQTERVEKHSNAIGTALKWLFMTPLAGAILVTTLILTTKKH